MSNVVLLNLVLLTLADLVRNLDGPECFLLKLMLPVAGLPLSASSTSSYFAVVSLLTSSSETPSSSLTSLTGPSSSSLP